MTKHKGNHSRCNNLTSCMYVTSLVYISMSLILKINIVITTQRACPILEYYSRERVFICDKTHADFYKTTSILSAYTTSVYIENPFVNKLTIRV